MSGDKLKGGHTSSVLCVDFDQQSGQVLSGGENGELCLWSSDGQLAQKISRPDCECTSVLFSQQNPKMVYATFGSQIFIYDMSAPPEPVFNFQANTDEVNQIALDGKEEFLGACDDAGEIKVYNLQTKKLFKTLRFKHTNICSSLTFRPHRPMEMISGGLDSRLVLWDFSKLKCLNQFNMQELLAPPDGSAYMINPPLIHHLASSASGQNVACALESGQIPVFNGSQKNLQLRFHLNGHREGVSQVQFLDETKLVSAGNDSKVVVWDLSKGSEYQPPQVYTNGDSGSLEEQKSQAISELCRIQTLNYSQKVNWMAVSRSEGVDRKLYVADQSSDISILSLQ